MAHPRVAWLALALVACSAPPAPPPPQSPPPATAPPARALDFTGAKTGEFRSKRFQMTLPLPDGHGWRIDDHTGSWLSATHAATQSELGVRLWAEEGKANNKSCEAAARVRRKLPEREGAEVASSTDVAAPAGFDTRAELLVTAATTAGGPVKATLIAFGGRLHRCFGYVFTTVADGPDAGRAVGARVATMLQASLRELKAVDELNPAAREELHPR